MCVCERFLCAIFSLVSRPLPIPQRWMYCSLCCCLLPEDSTRASVDNLHNSSSEDAEHKLQTQKCLFIGEKLPSQAYHGVLCSPSPSPHSLVVYCINELRKFSVYCHISARHVNHNRAFLRSIIRMSYDISHPIGSVHLST
jgi:hypothetical protein